MKSAGRTGRVGGGDPLLALLQPKKTAAQKMKAELLALRSRLKAPVKTETKLVGKQYRGLGIKKVVIDSGKLKGMAGMNFAMQHRTLKGGTSAKIVRSGGQIKITFYVMGKDIAADPGDLKRLVAARKMTTFKAPGAGLTLVKRKAMVVNGIRKLLGAARGKPVRAALVYFEARGYCETPEKARKNGYEKLSVAQFRREVATLKSKQPKEYAVLMSDKEVKRALRWMGRTKTRYIYVPTRKLIFD